SAARKVLIHAVEAVGPQRAARAAHAHVVNDDQRVLVAEQFRQTYSTTVRAREGVVLHLFRLDRRLRLAHLLAQVGDLGSVLPDLLARLLVSHRVLIRRDTRRAGAASRCGTAGYPRRAPWGRCRGSDRRR